MSGAEALFDASSLTPWVIAVVVGRAADIFKVAPGVAAAERLPSPWGITADDVLAGLYGLAAGWLATAVL